MGGAVTIRTRYEPRRKKMMVYTAESKKRTIVMFVTRSGNTILASPESWYAKSTCRPEILVHVSTTTPDSISLNGPRHFLDQTQHLYEPILFPGGGKRDQGRGLIEF
jgi:hypothetical protein